MLTTATYQTVFYRISGASSSICLAAFVLMRQDCPLTLKVDSNGHWDYIPP